MHGGAWRGTVAASYAFLSETFVRAGAHLAILEFTTVDQTGGDITVLVEQVLLGGRLDCYGHARELGADPERLYLCGHSSGADLGGCVVTTNWPARGLPADILKGAILASGMYDLRRSVLQALGVPSLTPTSS